jgi:hypothetical protein
MRHAQDLHVHVLRAKVVALIFFQLFLGAVHTAHVQNPLQFLVVKEVIESPDLQPHHPHQSMKRTRSRQDDAQTTTRASKHRAGGRRMRGVRSAGDEAHLALSAQGIHLALRTVGIDAALGRADHLLHRLPHLLGQLFLRRDRAPGTALGAPGHVAVDLGTHLVQRLLLFKVLGPCGSTDAAGSRVSAGAPGAAAAAAVRSGVAATATHAES